MKGYVENPQNCYSCDLKKRHSWQEGDITFIYCKVFNRVFCLILKQLRFKMDGDIFPSNVGQLNSVYFI